MAGMRILVIHATRDGQTARIAERMGNAINARGHVAKVLDCESPAIAESLGECDAVIVGGGIRYGKHPPALEKLVRRHFAAIVMRPNAFFSVSVSAGGPGARPAEASKNLERFLERCSWKPDRTATIAGALLYTRYNPLIRFLMKAIVGHCGGDTDTSRDYEYTDWAAVEDFALRCVPTSRVPLERREAA